MRLLNQDELRTCDRLITQKLLDGKYIIKYRNIAIENIHILCQQLQYCFIKKKKVMFP